MWVYLDNNVYSMIHDRMEETEVARLLKRRGARLLASQTNIAEAWRMRDPETRRDLTNTIAALATAFEPRPHEWYLVNEVFQELRRHRPAWVNRPVSRSAVRRSWSTHKDNWKQAVARLVPYAYEQEAFAHMVTSIVSAHRQTQQELRRAIVAQVESALAFGRRRPESVKIQLDPEDSDQHWRVLGFISWSDPARQQLQNFYSPYLTKDAFADPNDSLQLWLHEFDGDRLPRHRFVGLVHYQQLRSKIESGNAGDQLHAARALLVGRFVTADRCFGTSLQWAASHVGKAARICLINRSASSAREELEAALGAWQGR